MSPAPLVGGSFVCNQGIVDALHGRRIVGPTQLYWRYEPDIASTQPMIPSPQQQKGNPGVLQKPQIFEENRYVVMPSLVKEPALSNFYRYACRVAEVGVIPRGDDLLRDTPRDYGNFMMDGLLHTLLPDVEQASGLKLFPTYSYFRVYKRGDRLPRHSDRPACEISVSLCLGFEEKVWPIWIEGPRGVFSATLQPGDALLYRGIECPHWREPFEGSRQAQVFLHYVDRNGPHAEWKFDRRSSTTDTLPPRLG